MTQIEIYSAKCLECGYIMPVKFQLLSFSTFAPPQEDLDLSAVCDSCGSDNIIEIPHEHTVNSGIEDAGNEN